MNGTCACCDQPGQIIAHGWRWACYSRWTRAGRPADGPPPRTLLLEEERLAEYNHLRDGGVLPEEAGRRVGLKHERTIRRYEYQRKARRAA